MRPVDIQLQIMVVRYYKPNKRTQVSFMNDSNDLFLNFTVEFEVMRHQGIRKGLTLRCVRSLALKLRNLVYSLTHGSSSSVFSLSLEMYTT